MRRRFTRPDGGGWGRWVLVGGTLVFGFWPLGCDRNDRPGDGSESTDQGATRGGSDAHSAPIGEIAVGDPALLTVGTLGLSDDSLTEYIFAGIQGAKRLSDGGIVVADDGSKQVRRFDSTGRHLWSTGQRGEGPGDFRDVRLLPECTNDTVVTVLDIQLDRITELDGDGDFLRSWLPRSPEGRLPYSDLVCGSGGLSAFTRFEDVSTYDADAGDHYRWIVDLYGHRAVPDTSWLVRTGIPGPDRTRYRSSDGPRTWGRRPVLAADVRGVWLGVADDYSVERMDWSGSTVRVIRWSGPPLSVEQHHIDAWKDRYVAGFASDANRLKEFLDLDWPRIQRDLPSRFPAYSDLVAPDDGTLWVRMFERPGEAKEWHVFDRDGNWTHRLEEPQGMEILDISPTAVLAVVWRTGGVETLEVRELSFTAPPN